MEAEKKETLEQAENILRGLGKLLGKVIPQGYGFTLILWDTESSCSYIANVDPDKMKEALRQVADTIEPSIKQ